MLALPLDGEVPHAAPPTDAWRTRLSHRLARHLPTAPARIGPARALVSFTFDDAPACACTRGLEMLDAYGAKGTFYIAGGLIGTRGPHWRMADADQVAAIHAAGHEIGSHTFSHAFVPGLSAEAIVAESRRNRECLRAILPDIAPESFAFPYGFGSLRAKRALAGLYRSSRGIVTGVNAGLADRHYLRANPLVDGLLDAGGIARLMDEALARSGWLIFYGHDVVARPSRFGCAPALLEAALRAANERGIACVSVAEAMRRAA